MIDRNQVAALELWAGMTPEQRTGIITGLGADLALIANDFAGLPPQVCAGIAAGMTPPEDAGTETTEHTSRRKRGE